jgi:DNA repair photolyase
LGFSAGLDFESRIMVKLEAPELLRRELSSKKWQPQVVAMSGVTDCYQPAERRFQLTRRCLEVFAEFRNPVVVITKNHLVTRDVDVLKRLATHRAVRVYLSITTLDSKLARILEPRASTPEDRLSAVKLLSREGIPVGVMVAPVIPAINDTEIPAILQRVAEAGALGAGYVMLRLPYGVAPLFSRWLEQHFPERKTKVLNRIRAMRDGKLNTAEFGERMRGKGIFVEQIGRMFKLASRKAGLTGEFPPLSTRGFQRPQGNQLALSFDSKEP